MISKDRPPVALLWLAFLICLAVALPVGLYSWPIALITFVAAVGAMTTGMSTLERWARPHYWRKTLQQMGMEETQEGRIYHYRPEPDSEILLSIDATRAPAFCVSCSDWAEDLELRLRTEEDEGMGVQTGDKNFDKRFVVDGIPTLLMGMLSDPVRAKIQKIFSSPMGGYWGGQFSIGLEALTTSLNANCIEEAVREAIAFAKALRRPYADYKEAIIDRARNDSGDAAAKALCYLEEQFGSEEKIVALRDELLGGKNGDLRLAYAELHQNESLHMLQAMVADETLSSASRAKALYALSRREDFDPTPLARELCKLEDARLVSAALRVLAIRRAVEEGAMYDWMGNRFLWINAARLPECVRPYWIACAHEMGQETVARVAGAPQEETRMLAQAALENWETFTPPPPPEKPLQKHSRPATADQMPAQKSAKPSPIHVTAEPEPLPEELMDPAPAAKSETQRPRRQIRAEIRVFGMGEDELLAASTSEERRESEFRALSRANYSNPNNIGDARAEDARFEEPTHETTEIRAVLEDEEPEPEASKESPEGKKRKRKRKVKVTVEPKGRLVEKAPEPPKPVAAAEEEEAMTPENERAALLRKVSRELEACECGDESDAMPEDPCESQAREAGSAEDAPANKDAEPGNPGDAPANKDAEPAPKGDADANKDAEPRTAGDADATESAEPETPENDRAQRLRKASLKPRPYEARAEDLGAGDAKLDGGPIEDSLRGRSRRRGKGKW